MITTGKTAWQRHSLREGGKAGPLVLCCSLLAGMQAAAPPLLPCYWYAGAAGRAAAEDAEHHLLPRRCQTPVLAGHSQRAKHGGVLRPAAGADSWNFSPRCFPTVWRSTGRSPATVRRAAWTRVSSASACAAPTATSNSSSSRPSLLGGCRERWIRDVAVDHLRPRCARTSRRPSSLRVTAPARPAYKARGSSLP
jgi:hypothetical protein